VVPIRIKNLPYEHFVQKSECSKIADGPHSLNRRQTFFKQSSLCLDGSGDSHSDDNQGDQSLDMSPQQEQPLPNLSIAAAGRTVNKNPT
jgi:hypothetical protein